MTALETRGSATRRMVAPSAVVWIDEGRSMVAAMSDDGWMSTCEITRGSLPESAYLGEVVHAVGDRQRVVILGPSSVRLALEREYVAIFHRPDRLVDVELAGSVDRQELVDRLRTLVS